MDKQQVRFKLSKAKNGMKTVSAQIDDHQEFFLHSTVNPEREAKDWLARVELTPHTAYFVLGFGLGYHVQALLERLPEGSHVYVLEYSKEINLFNVAAKLFAKSRWMYDPRITYFATAEFRELAVSLAVDMGKRCINKVTLCHYYPAKEIFPEFFRQLERELVPRVEESFCLNFNNSITLGNSRIQNAWYNIPYICHSPGIKAFANRFAGKPAIIVAAGPSLNKNIEVLKMCTDRAVIIAAGSAMGALYINGITPSFLAVSDAISGMYDVDLAGVVDPNTILLGLYDVQHKVVSEYPGKKLFAIDQTTITLDSVKHLLPETDVLRQSISVATMAFSFALYCGANPIIFTGQDLSLSTDPNVAHHAIGVKASDFSKDDWQKTYVPGYDGGEVPTLRQFREVIQYFEAAIKQYPKTTFINATEGGAKIGGTVQLKLSEVYDRYLNQKIWIDKIIEDTYHEFAPQNFTELLSILLEIREEVVRTRRLIDEFNTVIAKEIEETSEWNALIDDRIEAQFVSFFDKLSNTNIYQYVKSGIAPFRELVEYRIREGMTFQYRIDAYSQLENDWLVVLECLDTAVQEGIVRMKKMNPENNSAEG